MIKKIIAGATAVMVAGVMMYQVPGEEDYLTWEEYQAYIELLDQEIKAKGGVTLENVTGENLLEKLNQELFNPQ